jgi:hypothetical protein
LATGEISKNETPIFVMSFHTSGAAGQKKTASLIKKETLKSEDQNTAKIGMNSHH